MEGQRFRVILLEAIGQVMAECKRATGTDELLDREVGPRLPAIIERAETAFAQAAAAAFEASVSRRS